MDFQDHEDRYRPAFPHYTDMRPGLTMRDFFAAAAMIAYAIGDAAQVQRFTAAGDSDDETLDPVDHETVAKNSYALADAMMARRREPR